MGPDKIHPHILKEATDKLTTPLTIIFNKSLMENRLPTDWNGAIIAPVHKKRQQEFGK